MSKKFYKPILVTGAVRSGTTFVGRILNLSGETLYLWEPFNMGLKTRMNSGAFTHWFEYLEPNSKKSDDVKRFLREYSKVHLGDFKRVKTKNPERRKFEFNILLKKIAFNLNIGHIRPLFKDPIAVFSAEWIYDQYKDVKVVMMTRNPVTFVESFVKLAWNIDYNDLEQQTEFMKFLTPEQVKGVKRFSKTHNNKDVVEKAILFWNITYTRFLSYQQNHPDWHFVKIEDIKNDPVKHFEKMYQYCELPFTEKVKKELTAQKKEGGGRWINNAAKASKRYRVAALTEAEKKMVVEQTKELAEKFGYNIT